MTDHPQAVSRLRRLGFTVTFTNNKRDKDFSIEVSDGKDTLSGCSFISFQDAVTDLEKQLPEEVLFYYHNLPS